jgi:hypothetical protein
VSLAAAARLLGHAALAAGYAFGKLLALGERLASRLMPGRGWRRVDACGVSLLVPPDWGDPEPLGDGAVVLHNRPRHHRVDGDAVWYGSAIELHVGGPELAPLPPLAPMSEARHSLRTASGPRTVSLRIANGVSEPRRREAMRVLRSVRPS